MVIKIHRGPIPPGTTFRLPAAAERVRTELETYYRALPGLLADGQAGKHVVVSGRTVHGTFDTFRDAVAFGRDTFGVHPFIAQDVDARMLEPLRAMFDTPAEAAS